MRQLDLAGDANGRYLKGLGRAFAGAILFSLPMLMTMELWQLGFAMDRLRLALLLALSVPLLVGVSHRIGFEQSFGWRDDLRDAFLASAEVAERDRAAYDAMSAAARRRMRDLVSIDAATEALRQALAQIDAPRFGAFGWDERDDASARVA